MDYKPVRLERIRSNGGAVGGFPILGAEYMIVFFGG